MDDEQVVNARGASTAERVAVSLRRRITEGHLAPGTRLSEEHLSEAMGVSRNTLRESFRLLGHEGLLVHHLNRGVFVRELDEADVVDLYRLRRTLECEVVRSHTGVDPAALDPLRQAVEAAEAASRRGDWAGVGTANMRFHEHLVALAGSPRLDELAGRLVAELRLLFSVFSDPRELYEPYIERNRMLLDLLVAGEPDKAAHELDRYLRDSEAELLAAFRRTPRSGDRPVSPESTR